MWQLTLWHVYKFNRQARQGPSSSFSPQTITMALPPPSNASHIPLPPDPGNPATLMDIAAARIYSDRLVASKCESPTTASGIKLLMPLIPVAGIPNGAVDEDIGAA